MATMSSFNSTPRLLVLATVACGLLAPAAAQERMVVRADDAKRRTCPSEQCGIVGRFFSGESVPVFERADGWSRVSLYYTAGCHDGRSSFVEVGHDECTKANGIVQGDFAEWVKSAFLAAEAGS
jgi:hypothetical protein